MATCHERACETCDETAGSFMPGSFITSCYFALLFCFVLL